MSTVYKNNKYLIGNASAICFPWSRKEPKDSIFIEPKAWVLRNIKQEILAFINSDEYYRCYINYRLIDSTKSLEEAQKIIEETLDVHFVKDNLKVFT